MQVNTRNRKFFFSFSNILPSIMNAEIFHVGMTSENDPTAKLQKNQNIFFVAVLPYVVLLHIYKYLAGRLQRK